MLKKLLIILFALVSICFLFFVFYTQVIAPIAFPESEIPKDSTEVLKQLLHSK